MRLAPALMLAVLCPLAAQEIPYTVAAEPWAELLGNHRARIHCQGGADAVWAHIGWRRHDAEPQRKAVLVAGADGVPIANVVAVNVTGAAGDVVFQPMAGVEDYYIYYMPRPEPPKRGALEQKGAYLAPRETASPEWVQRNGLTADGLASGRWKNLPRAQVMEFQSRTKFDSFYPMEVAATADEMAQLRKNHPEPYLVFAEDREHPIRMRDAIPLRWIRSGPVSALQGKAYRGELFVFQIGIYAQPGLTAESAIGVRFEGLQGPQAVTVPAEAFECFNTDGIDAQGQAFRKEFRVSPGTVGALWCAVRIPESAKPGAYQGKVYVAPAGQAEVAVRLDLTVSQTFLRGAGVDQPERLARLQWLNSKAGLEDRITSPYTPLRVTGDTVDCLGRAVRFGPQGFPAAIRAGTDEVLAAPVALQVDLGKGPLVWKGAGKVVSSSATKVVRESQSAAGDFRLHVRTTMEFDGGIGFDVRLTVNAAAQVSQISLELPLREAVVPYSAGMGLTGGKRPAAWQWKWTDQPQRWRDQGNNLEYFIWLGGVKSGLYCRLKSPLEDWQNGTGGGVSLAQDGAGRVRFRAQTGPRDLKAGQELNLSFRLLPTPLKPLDPDHWKYKYAHTYRPLDEIQATGATVVNVHHDQMPNLWINYPFLNFDLLVPYIQEAHAKGMKAKVYYTIRELTTRLPELWAFRSLGEEIYRVGGTQAHGAAYLDSWLQEHLVSGYAAAWITRTPIGEVDAAIRTNRESRLSNFYLGGLEWLVQNVGIDGLYLDEVAYPREMMQRVRRVLEARPGTMIDLHGNRQWWSCNSPVGYYMEHLPYIDRTWFGEAFNPDWPADFWLVEMSGLPFGLSGDMLQNPNPWRGMLFGMTARAFYGSADPSGICKLWDRFGIDKSEMIGWWDSGCPVKTDRQDILATVYRKPGRALVSIASWAPEAAQVPLTIDWRSLGIDPRTARISAPAIEGFQPEAKFEGGQPIPVAPKRGWLLLIE
ncbi:MAG: hypothetical protein HY821_14595 [Acidobacteria bacterium]|nr:hypothetical protein [Acidobacteriota bacterium]